MPSRPPASGGSRLVSGDCTNSAANATGRAQRPGMDELVAAAAADRAGYEAGRRRAVAGIGRVPAEEIGVVQRIQVSVEDCTGMADQGRIVDDQRRAAPAQRAVALVVVGHRVQG